MASKRITSKHEDFPYLNQYERSQHPNPPPISLKPLITIILNLDIHLLPSSNRQYRRPHLSRKYPLDQPRCVFHLGIRQRRLQQNVNILRQRFANLAQRHSANLTAMLEPNQRLLSTPAILALRSRPLQSIPIPSLTPVAVDRADETPRGPGLQLRVREVEALRSLAGPQLFGVGLQEVVDARLLRLEDAPVEERVHAVLQQVVQDEAAEELFAARVLVCRFGLVAEGEFEVGCLEAGFVAGRGFCLLHCGRVVGRCE